MSLARVKVGRATALLLLFPLFLSCDKESSTNLGIGFTVGTLPDKTLTLVAGQSGAFDVYATFDVTPSATLFVDATVEDKTVISVGTPGAAQVSARTVTVKLPVTALDEGVSTIMLRIGPSISGTTTTINVSVTVRASKQIAMTPSRLVEAERGTSTQFTATVTNAVDGSVATGSAVDWTSDAPDIASVDQTGKVTALKNGTAGILARIRGNTRASGLATTGITVVTTPALILLTPPSARITVGGTATLTTVVKSKGGFDMAPAEVTLSWQSNAPATATVTPNPNGTATVAGVAPGLANVTVGISGNSGVSVATSAITVTSAQSAQCVLSSYGLYADFFNVTIIQDPSSVAGQIQMPTRDLRTETRVTATTISTTGNVPFINVAGNFTDGCTFTATGQGTVAGRANVGVKMEGTFNPGQPRIYRYTMGTNNEFSGGPVVYELRF
jgi:hypothetical protein